MSHFVIGLQCNSKVSVAISIVSSEKVFRKCHEKYKLFKKSSLPLVKVKIFQKQLNVVELKVHQEERTHLLLILMPNW